MPDGEVHDHDAATGPRRGRSQRLARGAGTATTVLCIVWIVFAIVILALRYAVLPHADRYRDDLQKLASRASGETVTIGSISASWHGLHPSLALRDVAVVDDSGRTTLRLPSASATLSWRSLAVLELRLSSLVIDGATLLVERDADGLISVAGHPLRPKARPNDAAAAWLLTQDGIAIRGTTIVWHDAMVAAGDARPPPDFVMTDVAFALDRSGRRHRIALRASPPASIAAPLDVRAVIDHPLLDLRDDADPAKWSGEIYANVASGDVAAWRAWVPLPPTLEAGRGRFRAWLRFARADEPAGVFAQRLAERIRRPLPPILDRIAEVTTDLALDDVAVRWGTVDYAALAAIDGRVVAMQSRTVQSITGTRLALQPRGDRKVAPTDFDLHRRIGARPDDESGKATLGAIDIGVSLGLVPEPLLPPAIAAKLIALQPRGTLDHVVATWTGPVAAPRTFEAEVRFEQLGITAQSPSAEAVQASTQRYVLANGLIRQAHPPFGQPGFDHLSGTLRATRKTADGMPAVTEASIDLDGNEAIVVAPGLFDDPTLRFSRLAAHVGVRTSGDDVEVKVDHAALDNPDVAGTVDLVFRRGPQASLPDGAPSRGYIDLDARLSRGDVARVPRYLPNIVGPKARAYLAKALVAGTIGEATLRLRGALEQLDLRAQTDALARPFAVPIDEVLAGVQSGRRSLSSSPAPTIAAVGSSAATAEPVFLAKIQVHDATFLYSPARDPDAPPPDGTPTPMIPSIPSIPSIPWPAFTGMDADVVFDRARMTIHARTARYRGFVLKDVEGDLPALADPAHVLRVSGKGAGPLQDLVRFINEGPMQRWVRHLTDRTEATGDATLALAFDLPLARPRDARLAGGIGLENDELALAAGVPPFRHIDGRVGFTDRSLAIDALTAEVLGGPFRLDARTGTGVNAGAGGHFDAAGFIELTAAGTVDLAALRAGSNAGPNAKPNADATGTDDPVAARLATGLERATRVMSGSTSYKGVFRVRNARMAAITDEQADVPARGPSTGAGMPTKSELVVESDLVGLAIDLPAPLAKPAAARWPLRVDVKRLGTIAPASAAASTTTSTDFEDIHVTLADRVDVAITRRRDSAGDMAVAHAGYRVGDGPHDGPRDGPQTTAADESTEIRVALPSLDLDAWRDALRRINAGLQPATTPAAGTASDPLLPTRATLATATLRAAGRDFTHVSVAAQRMPTGWQADVEADQVAGRVSYTDVAGRTDARNGVAAAPNGIVVARLSKLSIPEAETTRAHVDSALDAGRQQDFPAIDLVADRFELRGRVLGRLEVQAENVGAGSGRAWKLDRLALTTPEARFTANGTWGHAEEAESTRLDFDLQASDVGALMDRFGLNRTIRDGSARLSGNAMWNGGPTGIDFSTLGGTLKLAADRGEFLKADPGVAKLLNILSLQGLARRLRLDFSDVFGPGFAFDTVRADATIERGIAKTDDFVMRGGLANVEMKGSADLQHETADLHVLVLPQINAGAASLGVAVINPAVGLGSLIAQYLFKDRISQALSFEYNVSGPWKTPEVVKIDHKGKVTPVRPKVATPVTPPAATDALCPELLPRP